jgi:putative PIN family toxin of toxin-antitoxin system
MLAAVIDTNVLVSATMNPRGAPGQIVSMVFSGDLCPYYNFQVLAEYREVLSRTKFGFPSETVRTLLSFIEHSGIPAVCEKSAVAFADENDRVFFDLAASNRITLVTGNLKHFPRHRLVMSVNGFLAFAKANGS